MIIIFKIVTRFKVQAQTTGSSAVFSKQRTPAVLPHEMSLRIRPAQTVTERGGIPYAARELSLNPAPAARVISLEMTVP